MRRSGRAMARTGLRMMPTFPSPSLKFRTVGFPQYGFKASLSEGAFPSAIQVKLAPSMPRQARGLLPPSHASAPATSSPSGQSRHYVRVGQAHPRAAVQEVTLFTPGVLGSGPSYVVSDHLRLLRPHPPVSQARGDFTGSPLIRHAFAVWEHRGDPRDVPSFPCRAFPPCRRPYAGGAAVPLPLPWDGDTRLPCDKTTSPPTPPTSASNTGGCRLSALHRSRHAAARRFASPSWLAPTPRTRSRPLCLLRTLSPPLLTPCLAARGWRSG
jgi:hypothetical protein